MTFAADMSTRQHPQRLVVVFDPRTPNTLQFARLGAGGAWEIIWLVDSARFDLGSTVRLLARFGVVLDIADLEDEEIAMLLEPLQPTGIVTFVDSELTRAARIARAVGLSFHTPDVALRLTNKLAQREAFKAAGLAVPRYWAVPASADVAAKRQVAGTASFPVIVKPQAGAGARETYRAGDAVDLLGQLDAFAAMSDAALADVIVEELLADAWERDTRPYADYVSVESVAEEGRLTHVAVTGRMPLAEPFRETGFFIQSNLSADVRAEVCELAGRGIEALGAATSGVFHTEIKITPHGPRLIEVNGRLGGPTADLLALCSDVKMLDVVARIALGIPTNIVAPGTFHGVAYLFYVQAPMNATSVVRLEGVREFGATEGITEFVVNKQPGAALDWREGQNGYVVGVLGWAPDLDSMFAVHRQLRNAIDIEYSFAGAEACAEPAFRDFASD